MRWFAIGVALFLAGCASSTEPTQADLKAEWESRNSPPVNAKGDIIAFMRTYLNNPSGLRSAGISNPFRKTLPGDPGERILVCVRYDARDTTGRYVGVKTGAAAFRSGRFEVFYDNPREAPELCKEAVYQPFPELERISR
ncbi:MAG: hypothetical protein JO254_06955 [Pseudolabrys sp.]|nr:hypothetical protein [Pseudolabrys sp.]